jgi:hypothetical protein
VNARAKSPQDRGLSRSGRTGDDVKVGTVSYGRVRPVRNEAPTDIREGFVMVMLLV